MTGCVGDDDFGARLLAGLRAEGIDADGMRVLADAPTGLAMICVDGAGENIITVASGANRQVSDADIAAALRGPLDVLVLVAEIPVPVIVSALNQARLLPVPPVCVLNLAPAPPQAADIVAAGADWLVVNQTEAAEILGRKVGGLADAAGAAADLVAAGARHAVVTAKRRRRLPLAMIRPEAASGGSGGPGEPVDSPERAGDRLRVPRARRRHRGSGRHLRRGACGRAGQPASIPRWR